MNIMRDIRDCELIAKFYGYKSCWGLDAVGVVQYLVSQMCDGLSSDLRATVDFATELDFFKEYEIQHLANYGRCPGFYNK